MTIDITKAVPCSNQCVVVAETNCRHVKLVTTFNALLRDGEVREELRFELGGRLRLRLAQSALLLLWFW